MKKNLVWHHSDDGRPCSYKVQKGLFIVLHTFSLRPSRSLAFLYHVGLLELEGFLGNLVAYVHLKDSYVCCALLDFGMEFVSFCDLETKNAFFEIGKTNLVDVVFRPCT